MQKPTVCRDVLFHEEGGPYASKITKVNLDGSVELVTFGPNSLYFQHNVSQYVEDYADPPKNKEQEDGLKKGKWEWPPRVGESIAGLPKTVSP